MVSSTYKHKGIGVLLRKRAGKKRMHVICNASLINKSALIDKTRFRKNWS